MLRRMLDGATAATLVALLGGMAGAQTVKAQEKEQPLVILMTIDGMPARALEDPRLPMPTLRALASRGAVAEAMQPINPTVTWPNHTALITGVDAQVHHVVANGLITFPADGSAPEIRPWVPKEELVQARTLVDAAAAKGLVTAQVDWVAIYGAKGVDWAFGEKPEADGPIARELIAEGMVTRDQVEHFGEKSSPAWRDEIWTDAAVDIVQKHTPNLLLLHLLETDSLQHQYGPMTPAAYAAYAYADAQLRRVVEAVRAIGAMERTTFFVTADHGFATYQHTISPNAVLMEQSLLHKDGSRYLGTARAKAEGGGAQVYLRDQDTRAELVPKLKALFEAVPGVEAVYTNEEARALGLPSEAKTDQAAQLYLFAKSGYAFSDDAGGPVSRDTAPRGQHGYLNTNRDMEAIFVASGRGVRQGVKLGRISNLQVAPSVAAVLGVSLPDATAGPLKAMFR